MFSPIVLAARTAVLLSSGVILMDVAMPDMNGMEATRQLGVCCPSVAVLALTIHEEEDYFFEMLDAGASGYIPKRAAPDDLLKAIRTVHRGEVFLHSSFDYLRSRRASGRSGDRRATGHQP